MDGVISSSELVARFQCSDLLGDRPRPPLATRLTADWLAGTRNLLQLLLSLWENSIKLNRGKFPQVGSSIQYILDEIQEQAVLLLPVNASHLVVLSTFDYHHKDPFDRMLAAQSIFEKMPLVTNDTLIDRYPVEIVW